MVAKMLRAQSLDANRSEFIPEFCYILKYDQKQLNYPFRAQVSSWVNNDQLATFRGLNFASTIIVAGSKSLVNGGRLNFFKVNCHCHHLFNFAA